MSTPFLILPIIFVSALPSPLIRLKMAPDWQHNWTRFKDGFLFGVGLLPLIFSSQPGQEITFLYFLFWWLLVLVTNAAGCIVSFEVLVKLLGKDPERRKEPPARDDDPLYLGRQQFDWTKKGLREKGEYYFPYVLGFAIAAIISYLFS